MKTCSPYKYSSVYAISPVALRYNASPDFLPPALDLLPPALTCLLKLGRLGDDRVCVKGVCVASGGMCSVGSLTMKTGGVYTFPVTHGAPTEHIDR